MAHHAHSKSSRLRVGSGKYDDHFCDSVGAIDLLEVGRLDPRKLITVCTTQAGAFFTRLVTGSLFSTACGTCWVEAHVRKAEMW